MKIENPEQFDTLVNAIASELANAKRYYELFIELDESFSEYHREVNRSRVFWSLTRDSLKARAVLGLCRAYDPHHNTNSLPNLLKLMEKEEDFATKVGNSNIFGTKPNLASIDRQRLLKDIDFTNHRKPPVKRLKFWRDRIFVHNDWDLIGNMKSVSTEVPEYADLEILLDNGLEIVNRYLYLFRQTTQSAKLMGHDDFKFVLKCIRDC